MSPFLSISDIHRLPLALSIQPLCLPSAFPVVFWACTDKIPFPPSLKNEQKTAIIYSYYTLILFSVYIKSRFSYVLHRFWDFSQNLTALCIDICEIFSIFLQNSNSRVLVRFPFFCSHNPFLVSMGLKKRLFFSRSSPYSRSRGNNVDRCLNPPQMDTTFKQCFLKSSK